MAATGKIKTIFTDKEKTEAIFPRTKVSAISDENGVGLDAILDTVLYTGSAQGNTAVVPVNADTLNGRPASEYATEAFVAEKIAEVQLNNDIDFPVDSVNGKVGDINLTASDVGAAPREGVAYAEDVIGDYAIVPLNADTLGGKLPSEFAPSGFGLGGGCKVVSSPNEATETGFYAVMNDAEMPANHWWVGYATKYVNGYLVQHFTRLVSGEKVQRYMDNGVWQPWEWENPHMYVGTEYRTTERYNGKPVYVRAIETGELPNNNFKQYLTGINYANIVDYYMLMRRADIQYVYKITYDAATFWYEGAYFVYFPKSDMSQWSGTIFYKYTKD